MKLIEAYLKNNDCYKANRTITVKGLIIHSIGCPQPVASKIFTGWDAPNVEKCVHGFIEPGTVYQTLPWNHRGWHGGGKSNDSCIGVEMTEPATIKYTGGSGWVETGDGVNTKAHVMGTYKTAVELFAHLCKEFKLDPLADGVIISHAEGYKRGIASNHGDPEHLWNKFGLTMAQFRKDIKAAMGSNVMTYGKALEFFKSKVDYDVGYWKNKANIDPYFDDLLIKFATAWQKEGK